MGQWSTRPAHTLAGTKEAHSEGCQCLASNQHFVGIHQSVDYENTWGLCCKSKCSLPSGLKRQPLCLPQRVSRPSFLLGHPTQIFVFISAFQHPLPESLGNGRHSRPQRHMPPSEAGKGAKNYTENIQTTGLWSPTDAPSLPDITGPRVLALWNFTAPPQVL